MPPKVSRMEAIRDRLALMVRDPGLWFLGAAVLFLFLYRFFVSYKNVEITGGGTVSWGFNIVLTVAVLIPLWLVALRKWNKLGILLAMLVLYMACVWSWKVAVYHRDLDENIAAREIIGQIFRVYDLALARNVPETVNVTPVSASAIRRAEKCVKEFNRALMVLYRQYREEMDALGLDRFTDAKRLEGDVQFAESKKLVESAKQVIKKYEDAFDMLMQDTAAEMSRWSLHDPANQAVVTEFFNTPDHVAMLRNMIFSVDAEVLPEWEAMLAQLADKTKWVVEGGKVAFYDRAETGKYNQHFVNIMAIKNRNIREAEEFVKREKQKLEAAFNRLGYPPEALTPGT